MKKSEIIVSLIIVLILCFLLFPIWFFNPKSHSDVLLNQFNDFVDTTISTESSLSAFSKQNTESIKALTLKLQQQTVIVEEEHQTVADTKESIVKLEKEISDLSSYVDSKNEALNLLLKEYKTQLDELKERVEKLEKEPHSIVKKYSCNPCQ